MPFYSFKCENCEIEDEKLVKMGTEETECSGCGGQMKKLPSFRTVALGLPNGFHTIREKTRKVDE
jgi:putative FmdB family regulatory protein